jgi:uncharacterized protein
LSAVAAWAARNARAVLVVSALLALAAGLAATQLPVDAGPATLVSHGSESYRATERVRQAFGEEPVVVLAEGDLQELVLTPNLERILRLEGCLSGKVPRGAKPIPGPCAELAKLHPVQFLVGPGTFLNEAVIQIDRQLERMARHVPAGQLREFLLDVAARYGITSVPSIGNPEFIAAVVFDLRRARGTPKARLAYLFPNGHSAQILIRLRSDLGEAERSRALGLIRDAVHDVTPRRACAFRGRPQACFALHGGGEYVVSGAPVVAEGIAGALKDALLVLFGVAVAVMAFTLLLAFRSRFRLLPLAIALGAAALTFGLLEAVGGALTLASIAVLPILIGLVVDYAIQLQARYDEAVAGGARGAEAAGLAAARGAPAVGVACLATVAGFLVLLLSPLPMIRGFSWLLAAGVLIGFALALLAGSAALALRPPPTGDAQQPGWSRRYLGIGVSLALSRPRRVLGVGALLAVLGWGLATQIGTTTDVRDLAPGGSRAIRDLSRLQGATGVSGQLEVAVEAPDLSDPATIRWMAAFKRRVLSENGFSGPRPSCLEAEICPGPALSDFFGGNEGRMSRREIRETLRELPSYDLAQVAPVDRRTGLPGHLALLSFGIRDQSLERQQELIDRVRTEVGSPGAPGGPPPGVRVRFAGLPVIAASAASSLSASRWWLALVGLLAVALVLLVAYRSPRRAVLPLVPVLLAGGWSSLALWLTRTPLNPMSAALGVLTVAIATEFSVILAARFDEELAAGPGAREALHAAYARTGPAVLASAATVIAGFAVLIVSDIGMLREFGLVTVLDLVVALLGVMLALPAALAWLEER